MRPARLRGLLATAAIAGLGLTGAACQPASPYAAIVSGTRVSQDTLLRELHALGTNKAFVAAYNQSIASGQGTQLPVFSSDTASPTYTAGFAAVVLGTDIQAQVVHAEIVHRHIAPTAAAITAARTAASAQFGSDPATNKPVFDSFNAWFQREYEVRQAETTALRKVLPPITSDDAAVQKFYDTNPQDFITSQCVSEILVATKQQAVSIRNQLLAGADFGALAKKSSIDPASAAKGGSLPCGPPGQNVTAFEEVADTTPVGQLTQPVKTQFGWHVIKVTSRQLTPLSASLRTAIQQHLQQQDPVSSFLSTIARGLAVQINPAYGTWDPIQFQVIPPPVPSANSGIPTTTVPAVSAQTTPASPPATDQNGNPVGSTPTTSAPASTAPPAASPTSTSTP